MCQRGTHVADGTLARVTCEENVVSVGGASDRLSAKDEDDAPGLTALLESRLSVLHRIEYLLAGLLVLFIFWSISLAKVVLLPLVLGFLIALTLSPLVRALGKIGVPAPVSAIALVVTIGLGSAMSIYMLTGPASALMAEVPQIQVELRQKMAVVQDKIRPLREAGEQMQEMASGGNSGQEGDKVIVDGPGIVARIASSAAGTGTVIFVALILAMFLLSAGDMYQHKLVEAFPRFGDKKRALRISHDIERQISRYLAAITVINALLGIAVGVTLHLIGMPYPHLWGVAAFLLNYLPFLGAMIGTAAVAAVALVTFDTIGEAMLAPLGYLFLTSIEGQMLTPWLVGRHLKLNAAAVFVAVVFWAWIWGVAGALMAVPFLVFLKVVCDNVPPLRVLGLFLSGRNDPLGVTGPPTPGAGAE